MSLSIYVHIPFCRTRCGYCDFNTYAGLDDLKGPYINAIIKEIKRVAEGISGSPKIHSIFFGGGTPTLLSSDQFRAIFHQVTHAFTADTDLETTTEANPTGMTEEFFRALNKLGVNRLSLGMQSASAQDLKILGRRHTFGDVEASVESAKKAGFENISLDLIFGIPRQTLASFKRTLESALNLEVNHLSLYALTVEDGTPLARQIAEKRLPEPDEDLAADMYLNAMDILEKSGFNQYEISNWSGDDHSQCRHNLQYWRNHDYLGFGAGAHSHYNHTRWENQKTIKEYISSVSGGEKPADIISPAGITPISLSRSDEMSETMMMGLRLTEEGVSSAEFFDRFGIMLEDIYAVEIAQLTADHLVEWVFLDSEKHLRLTKNGRLLGNQVFMQFITEGD